MANGQWLILQNCHLAPQTVAKSVQLLMERKELVNSSFKLWIIALEHPELPFNVLQQAYKGEKLLTKIQNMTTLQIRTHI